jgi:hypothetical protein
MSNVLRKLGVLDRTQAARHAREPGTNRNRTPAPAIAAPSQDARG